RRPPHMRKVLLVLVAAVVSVSMVLAGCGEAEPEAKPTIKLSDLNWGSAHFQSGVAKIIIEKGYGYPVELVEGKTIALFTAARTGDLDVFLEGWLPNQQEAYDEAMAAGDIIHLGFINNDNWQSLFVVPTYVIKGDPKRGIEPMAPNLKSVLDLAKPEYKELFKNPENPGKGRIVTCVPGWECEKINMAQLAAYGLDDDYDLINPGSGASLHAGLKGAYEKGEPYITYEWGPTWIGGMLDLTRLEEPAYSKAVWDENNGCGYPSSDLFVVGHKDFPSKAPEVAEMFRKWKMDTKTLGEALAYMQDTGGEPVDAAIWHLKNREEVWTKFVPSDVATKVKAAVVDM
ncbi:glycine betaine ABC transporter substrate-binding protein, partial [Chloroflexota bacterium]